MDRRVDSELESEMETLLDEVEFKDPFDQPMYEARRIQKYKEPVLSTAPAPPTPPAPKQALDVQVGGDHYKRLAIQPMEYSVRNNLDPLQHTAIKYITRHKDKDGVVDIDKAIHCLELIKQMQYPDHKSQT